MKKHITSSDFQENLQVELHIPYVGFNYYAGDRDIVTKVMRANSPVRLQSVEAIMQSYNVTEDVAQRINSFQNDLLTQFYDTVEVTLFQADKYLTVKPYIRMKRYDISELEDYVIYDFNEAEFEKRFNPKRFIMIRISSLMLSFVLLALVFYVGFVFHDGLHLDIIGGGLILGVWFATNIKVILATPSSYMTRKLIYGFNKNSS